MSDELRKYWEHKLLESIKEEPMFKVAPLTRRERLHNRYLNLVDAIYHKLTGNWPHEE